MEKLLGTSLTSSHELEQITQGADVTLAITDPDRAGLQLRTEGIVSPDGILVYLPFRNHKETGLDPDAENFPIGITIPIRASIMSIFCTYLILKSHTKNQSEYFRAGSLL